MNAKKETNLQSKNLEEVKNVDFNEDAVNASKATLKEMFLSFFKIGAFTFGGGYAMIPIMEREFIENKKWITKEQFIDIVSLSQSFPGVLAANVSTFIGNKLFGFGGAALAVFSVALPSIIIILMIAMFFGQFRQNYHVDLVMRGINAAVPALILIALVSLSKNLKKNLYNLLVLIATLVALVVFNVHPLIVMITAGTLGIIKYSGGFANDSNK